MKSYTVYKAPFTFKVPLGYTNNFNFMSAYTKSAGLPARVFTNLTLV